MKKATSGKVSQNARRNSARKVRKNVKEKKIRTRRKTERLKDQGNTRRTVMGCFQKKLKELEEVDTKIEKSSLSQDT